MFRFANPLFLLLLLILPLLVWWSGRERPAGLRYADVGLVKTVVSASSWRTQGQSLLPVLRWLGLALLIVALARPQRVNTSEVIQGEGVDIVLVLDISSSMGSLDFFPQNRLEAAKQVIGEFVLERPYDRLGLVVFAAEAFVQSPPTVDHAVLGRLLRFVELAPALGLDDGTAIGTGLALGANMLKDSAAESKVVILLTDGVNNAGQIAPITAAEAAKALDIKVYTIGAGRPDPLLGDETLLDEDTLRRIADTTGGLYFRARDAEGLQQIYAEINELEKTEIDIQIFTNFEELMGQWLLFGLSLLVAEFFLQQTVLRRIP
jgi:Ca-activated chloride channel family protein